MNINEVFLGIFGINAEYGARIQAGIPYRELLHVVEHHPGLDVLIQSCPRLETIGRRTHIEGGLANLLTAGVLFRSSEGCTWGHDLEPKQYFEKYVKSDLDATERNALRRFVQSLSSNSSMDLDEEQSPHDENAEDKTSQLYE